MIRSALARSDADLVGDWGRPPPAEELELPVGGYHPTGRLAVAEGVAGCVDDGGRDREELMAALG